MRSVGWTLAAGLVATLATAGSAEQTAEPTVSVGTGSELFKTYCASCHGIAAKGDGPLAAALRFRPADLTQIAKRIDGKFESEQVSRRIDGRESVKGHGGSDMPVWGEVFITEKEKQKYSELTSLLKAKIIAEYIATLQR